MLSNRNIVITGASSGIGRQTAILCSALNAAIVVIGRNLSGLEETKKHCRHPEKVKIVQLDLSHYSQVDDEIIMKLNYEEVNGFVHCAGLSSTLPLKLHHSNIFEDTFSVNLIGGIKLIIDLGSYLIPNSSVVFMSSVMSASGQKAKHSYCASKGAVDAAMRCLALDMASRSIRVNAVLPSVIETPLANTLFMKMAQESIYEILEKHPLGLGKLSDVAHMVAFLLSDFSSNISGQSILVDGGYLAQ
jgi:NAD(P)-dependent dehydrogenase (short-subunit alcohol dehydrogenase family)